MAGRLIAAHIAHSAVVMATHFASVRELEWKAKEMSHTIQCVYNASSLTWSYY